MSQVSVQALQKVYGDGDAAVQVLHGIDLELASGEVVAIIGASGCGKSTLLACLAGLDTISAGKIAIAGVDLASLSPAALAAFRGEHIGFVFQSFRLLPTLTAQENIRVPLELAGRADAISVADDWLQRVGLAKRGHHLPSQLSGGEQQRVALARALAPAPSLILADEPTGNLDRKTGEQMTDLFLQLVREHQATVLLVTHDPALAERADRVLRIVDGQLFESDATSNS